MFLWYVINIQVYWFVIWDKLLLIIWVWMKNKMEQMSACSLEGLRICLEQVIVPPELMGYIYKYDTCGMCVSFGRGSLLNL